jgi:uncharacterized protein YcbK (DUF882 family)
MTDGGTSRRQLIRGAGGLLLGGSLLGALGARTALAADAPRSLSFVHLHTNERLSVTYWTRGGFVNPALAEVNHVLRDWRTGKVAAIDPNLLDLLYALRLRLSSSEPYQVICGYRCPETNSMLAERSSGVARNSMHTQGRAIDIALPGRDLARVHDTALAMQAGGVGYYPKSGFVHVDTGRVRHWG